MWTRYWKRKKWCIDGGKNQCLSLNSTFPVSWDNSEFIVNDCYWCFILDSTRMPAQTRAYSPFLNLRTSSWQRRSSLMTSAETWDSWDEIWQVCDVTTSIFTANYLPLLFFCEDSQSNKYFLSLSCFIMLDSYTHSPQNMNSTLCRQTVSFGIRVTLWPVTVSPCGHFVVCFCLKNHSQPV